MSDTHRSVVCFPRNRGEILLIRPHETTDAAGRWSALSAPIETDPERDAREAVGAVTTDDTEISLVRAGEPFTVETHSGKTETDPFLFDLDSRAVESDDIAEFDWVPPTEIRRRETVPYLWDAYHRIASTVETVESDTEHGSAWLSVAALSVLRDHAGGFATSDESNGEPDWGDLSALAERLRAARPSMAVVRNRVDRTMSAAHDDRTPEAVERAAIAGIERAFEADAAAACEAADLLSGTVMTLSRSGTVLDALGQAEEISVVVGESRPAREGVGVAEALVDDHPVTLTVDAALPHLLTTRSVDCILLGADAVLPDGSVVNKVGTRGIAIAATHESIPTYAVAASDKITPETDPDFEEGPREAVYDGDEAVEVTNPTFDRTPAEFVTVVTEDGPLDPLEIADRADEHAELADRTQDTSSDLE